MAKNSDVGRQKTFEEAFAPVTSHTLGEKLLLLLMTVMFMHDLE